MGNRRKDVDLLRVIDLLQPQITPGTVSDRLRAGAQDRAPAGVDAGGLVRF
jgi:hypothetical protein